MDMRKTLVLLASIAFALVMLSSCKSEPKTLTSGQWTYDFLGDKTTYIFNEDGSGKFITSKGDGWDFTYTVKEDSIIMDNGDLLNLGQNDYSYKINGDELKLKQTIFGFDTETVYKWEERK